jgi:hypothetical protein
MEDDGWCGKNGNGSDDGGCCGGGGGSEEEEDAPVRRCTTDMNSAGSACTTLGDTV